MIQIISQIEHFFKKIYQMENHGKQEFDELEFLLFLFNGVELYKYLFIKT